MKDTHPAPPFNPWVILSSVVSLITEFNEYYFYRSYRAKCQCQKKKNIPVQLPIVKLGHSQVETTRYMQTCVEHEARLAILPGRPHVGSEQAPITANELFT
jgi:hypothetical protein